MTRQSSPVSADTRKGRTSAGWLATGSVLGALAASSCCLLPFVLVSLGLGGAWMSAITGLGPYQPYFMVATGGLLLAGFWQVYRPAAEGCEADGNCTVPISSHLVKAALWGATLLLLAVLLVPDLVPMFMAGSQ